MASKRKDGRWAASLLTPQGRKWFYGSTEREAEDLKSNFRDDPPSQASAGTLGRFVETVWWPRIQAKTKIPTQKRYADIWRLHISRFEDHRVDGVKLEEVQGWLNSLDLAPKTVGLIREVLVNILNLAEKTRRIPVNEARWSVVRNPPKKRIRRDLNIEHMKALLAKAKGTDMEGPVFAAAFLGLRRGEVCGLKRTDLDFKTSKIHLQRTRNKSYEGPLKKREEGEERVLAVTPEIMARLKSYIEPDAIYVFSWLGRPVNPDRLTHNMENLCRSAGVPRMTFHDLRAAAASNLRALGVDFRAIMAILGHSRLETAMIYQDEREEDVRAALGLLNEQI